MGVAVAGGRVGVGVEQLAASGTHLKPLPHEGERVVLVEHTCVVGQQRPAAFSQAEVALVVGEGGRGVEEGGWLVAVGTWGVPTQAYPLDCWPVQPTYTCLLTVPWHMLNEPLQLGFTQPQPRYAFA